MDRELAIKRLNKMRRVCDMEECNINCELCEEALDLAIEALGQTESEDERDFARLFNKSFWRMGMHDSNVRPRTMADTSTNEGDAESATTTDCISRRDALKPFCITSDGTRIPEVDCDNFPVEFSVKDIKRHLLSLPPVTPTVSEDFISREQVRAKLDYISYAEKDPISIAKRIVENAPSVTPTERTGEWIFNPKDAIDLMFTKPKCNKCGFESADGGNFCPNCGAKMKGGAENE